MQPSSDYIFQTAGEGLEHDPAKACLWALTRWVQTGFPLSMTNAERGCTEMLKQ